MRKADSALVFLGGRVGWGAEGVMAR